MMYVLIGFAAACLAAVVVLALKLASALRDVNAAGDLWRAQCAVTDAVLKERDQLATANATLTKQLGGALSAKDAAEAHVAELAAKVVRLTTKNIASASLDEGAAIVNDMFATPLRGPK